MSVRGQANLRRWIPTSKPEFQKRRTKHEVKEPLLCRLRYTRGHENAGESDSHTTELPLTAHDHWHPRPSSPGQFITWRQIYHMITLFLAIIPLLVNFLKHFLHYSKENSILYNCLLNYVMMSLLRRGICKQSLFVQIWDQDCQMFRCFFNRTTVRPQL